MVTNWIIMAVGMLLLVYLGIRANKIASSDDEAGFLLGARSFGPFVMAGTIMATGFSGWGFVGAPGVVYEYGFTELLANFFFSLSITAAILFFGNYLRTRAGEIGSLTLPEYIRQRHQTSENDPLGPLVQGTAAIINIILMVVFMVAQTKALGLICSKWLGLSFNMAALLMLVIIITYTAMGGLAAVAWTDTIMVIGMSLGCVVILLQIFGDMSLADLVAKMNSIDPELVNPTSGRPYGHARIGPFLVAPYAFMFAAVLPYMCVRFLGVRENVKWRHIGAISVPLGMVLSLIPLVGAYVRVKENMGVIPPLGSADMAMPIYLQNFMPGIFSGIISLFIVFAMGSTANSVLQVLSASVSHDLRKAVMGKKLYSSKAVLIINRSAVVVMGIIGFVAMLSAPPAFLNFISILGTGTLQAAMAGPVFIGTLWRGNSIGAMISMLGGGSAAGCLLLFTDMGWVVSPLIGDVVGIGLYIVVSRLTFAAQCKEENEPVREMEQRAALS
ncbi:sodium:solute symporter family protein [Desulforhopalus singaporensis]|uniref:Sodium/pantothenate symporter n=1 Tax=Desulforhopalus singaporensis TaxID=91360 RepID=A0A1H0SJ44_9BACT|nr:sodium:solute symporter family protein [Desulforhopalus singaporensis]SDP41801.1 sodium/pantothenate symporter [Desulforhopalus singaporensis]